ncbi:hypothetical protein SUGI_1515190 [Cryptomeria japonica]|uniref:Kinetochore protein NDC80 n=1 Tax=Cryptomeria japonica TaxID=3369 RepID=A0AAD3NTG1_CRYJA|nr:probable kinetochore protein ndc80 [Cryptomeria japonica]GLJ59584.1 hypothetical protein SUGI_1515190 [Cryptomeria japonica]
MFTSKLPTSTSVRRPTINADGSTSFIGLNRASNIPVSVRKANLFTPQTNRRPFMSGASTAGKSYTSTTDRNQPRSLKPNPDRDEQMKMFDHLVNFLRSNADHIPPPEPKKFFASVSTSESSRIFEFLILRCQPDFKFVKLETSVPEALALLEYPYIRSVTRSALLSVTTRNAAVGLLVIFDWLIVQAETPDEDEFADLEDPDDPDDPDQVINELYKNVNLYREGSREASKESFHKLYPIIELQSIQDELLQVSEETVRLKQSLENIDDLEHDLACRQEDLVKWKDYHVKMKDYMESKRTAEKEANQYNAKLASQNEELAARVEKLDLEVKTHRFSIEDIEIDKAAIARLESKQSLLLTELKDAYSDSDQLENDHRKCLNELKTKTIQKLQGILQNKENELRKLESEKDFNISKFSERRAKEEQMRLDERQVLNVEISNIRGAIALKQKEFENVSAEINEMSALQQQYRQTLQKNILMESSSILDDTRKCKTELLAALATREKDNEVVKRFLKRFRRLAANH